MMPTAKGRSNIRSEIDLLEDALLRMIDSIENEFRRGIDSIKAQIFDIEHQNIEYEEMRSLECPFYTELDSLETQLFQARNKLVICIYSICEASLAGIFNQFSVGDAHRPENSGRQDYYLSDYLCLLGVDYKSKGKKSSSSAIVYNGIRPLRNYLTHAHIDSDEAEKIVKSVRKVNLDGITNDQGYIQVETADVLKQILKHCKEMLIESEEAAMKKYNK